MDRPQMQYMYQESKWVDAEYLCDSQLTKDIRAEVYKVTLPDGLNQIVTRIPGSDFFRIKPRQWKVWVEVNNQWALYPKAWWSRPDGPNRAAGRWVTLTEGEVEEDPS